MPLIKGSSNEDALSVYDTIDNKKVLIETHLMNEIYKHTRKDGKIVSTLFIEPYSTSEVIWTYEDSKIVSSVRNR